MMPHARKPDLTLALGSGAEPERLLTAADVARILSVRSKRVYELGIPYVRISERAKRWRRSDIDTWINSRRSAG